MLSDYDMGANGYNGVWYDAEYGIPLKYTQGRWIETYTVVPGVRFDAPVFTYNADTPVVSLTLDKIQAGVSGQAVSAQENADVEADKGKLSLETLEKIPAFSSSDMNGETVTNKIFNDYHVTLVNLWGTWRAPCVAEMPSLQKLYEAYRDSGLNVIGVTENANGNDDLIREIVDTQGVIYTILYPSAEFYDDFVSLCFKFPTYLLVDSEGNVLKVLAGDPGYAQMDTAINEALRSFR